MRREFVRWLLFCGVPSSLIVLVTLVSGVASLWPCVPAGPFGSTAVVIVLSLLAYALVREGSR